MSATELTMQSVDDRQFVAMIESVVWGPLCAFLVYAVIVAFCVAYDLIASARRRSEPGGGPNTMTSA